MFGRQRCEEAISNAGKTTELDIMIMPGVHGQWEEGKHEHEGQIMKGFGRNMNDSQFHSAVNRKPFHFYLFFFSSFFHIIRVWLHFHKM